MKEVPAYEQYPVNEEGMGKRYKNWTEGLAYQLMLLYRVGKKTGGEKFIEELKEEFFKMGKNSARLSMKLTGTTKEDFTDCSSLPKICDTFDDSMANFWDGYIENTPEAFEKELTTCPVARLWQKTPELCEVYLYEMFKAMGEELNPKYKFLGFSKLLPKGDKCCRYRIEIEDN